MSKRLRTPAEVSKEGGDMTKEEFLAWMEAIRKTEEFYKTATIDDLYLFTDDPDKLEELVAQAERENKIVIFNVEGEEK